MSHEPADGNRWKHSELSARILGCAMQVSNQLGAGFLESVYHNALVIALSKADIAIETQKPFTVCFEGYIVGKFYADLVVGGTIVVELKAIRALVPEHSAQVLNYLKASGLEVGLLLNFGVPRMEDRRLVMSPTPPTTDLLDLR